MSDVTLDAVGRPFAATITPPGSKSLTNRALVLSALAAGTCELTNVLFADDTDVMLESLGRLGFPLAIDRAACTVLVEGGGGRIGTAAAELFCANSGTTIRFLTALCALGHGRYTLDGVARMRQRPIGTLTALLRQLGAHVSHPGADGFPPVQVDAEGLAGGRLRYGKEPSSQYLSAILMVAPYARGDVRVALASDQTSWPYVAMTVQLMARFGIAPELIGAAATGRAPREIVVKPGAYAPTRYAVEPDASNASYFLAAAAVNPGSRVTIEGLDRSSLQGDVHVADVLQRMGADLAFEKDVITITGPARLAPVDVDLSAMPDMAQTLAVVCLFATGRSTLRGLGTLRVKETDRIAALSAELKKLGASVYVDRDAMSITPAAGGPRAAAIDTYDDHRMAMSFAVAGTRVRGITIRDAECVSKTYPGFFDDLRKVCDGIR